METTPDLGPAARRMADLLGSVTDDQLNRPTPCEKYTLGDLIEHVGGLALAFTWAARKSHETARSGAPSGDVSRLDPEWRTVIPSRLDALAEAWREPGSWEGMTRAGGVDLPGGVAGRVALDELVIHAWDIARATRQPFECSALELDICADVLAHAVPTDQRPAVGGAFAPAVPIRASAPLLDRVVALSGRDPGWTAP